jgi:hypothetical protein
LSAISFYTGLIKEKQLFIPKLAREGDIKGVLFKKYGIDTEFADKPEEWDNVIKTEIAIDAASARDKINALKKEIDLPKVMTAEERSRIEQTAITEKNKVLAPIKEKFLQFDKFSNSGFEYIPSDEYKSNLPEMFDAMFIQANMPVNEDNIGAMFELRDALFLLYNFSKIKDVIGKEAVTE